MMRKITKSVVDAVMPSEKDVFVWDSEAKGFGLKVTPKGRRVYVVQYRLPGTPTKRFTIGQHGSPWTPFQARTEALRVLGLAASGLDPAADKKRAKADITVAELCRRYSSVAAQTKKQSTRDFDQSLINAHIVPLLGRRQVRSISTADVQRFMRDVANGKTARDEKTKLRGRSIVKGGTSAANRTLGLLSPIMEYAINEGLRSDNPARGVKKFKEGRPARFLSDAELAQLGDALRQSEKRGVNAFALAAIKLLLLTGCRKNEILTLKWEEIDFERGFLRLSDSKTGYKTVPVGKAVLNCLSQVPKVQGNPYVISGSKDGAHFVGLQKVWVSVRSKAGLDDVRLHDLRHSFASVGARSGQSLFVIGKVLGHASSSTTQRYAHLSDDPVRSAAQMTAHSIARGLDGDKD